MGPQTSTLSERMHVLWTYPLGGVLFCSVQLRCFSFGAALWQVTISDHRVVALRTYSPGLGVAGSWTRAWYSLRGYILEGYAF